ncbi:MAG: glycosyltransferase [Pseudooceanicola atlanticus]
MATYNGAPYLRAQLMSFAAQRHANWSLRIRDDGSRDETLEVIDTFCREHPERDITVTAAAPGGSSAANFLNLLAAGDWPEGACLALSDQDDIWMAHRLKRALSFLAGQEGPQIYASRTILMDETGRSLRLSRRHPRAPAFENALVQNILAGNTIILDPAAADLARRTAPAALAHRVPHHDWWLYQLLTGAGGRVVLDQRPGVYYRQHQGNVLGANQGVSKGLTRFAMLWRQDYSAWIDANLAALQATGDALLPENAALVRRFARWRQGGAHRGTLRDMGVWRQTAQGDRLLALSARLGRL